MGKPLPFARQPERRCRDARGAHATPRRRSFDRREGAHPAAPYLGRASGALCAPRARPRAGPELRGCAGGPEAHGGAAARFRVGGDRRAVDGPRGWSPGGSVGGARAGAHAEPGRSPDLGTGYRAGASHGGYGPRGEASPPARGISGRAPRADRRVRLVPVSRGGTERRGGVPREDGAARLRPDRRPRRRRPLAGAGRRVSRGAPGGETDRETTGRAARQGSRAHRALGGEAGVALLPEASRAALAHRGGVAGGRLPRDQGWRPAERGPNLGATPGWPRG